MSELARSKIKPILPKLTERINRVLRGENLKTIAPILRRIDAKGELPYWFGNLRKGTGLPNLDGKTVGSIVEKISVSVIEAYFLPEMRLSINPAKGVDVPELELGIKSPSTNGCTSEPFFSPYERLLGNENDALVLLTNYQDARKQKGNIKKFTLQIIQAQYLEGSQIADKNLCAIARKFRERFPCNQTRIIQALKFLAYVNQQDWDAKRLIELMSADLDDSSIDRMIANAVKKFDADNKKKLKANKALIPESMIDLIRGIGDVTPRIVGLLDAAEAWVRVSLSGSARDPNENEFKRLMASPLNGSISMSFALQWRYNFKGVFPGVKFSKAKQEE